MKMFLLITLVVSLLALVVVPAFCEETSEGSGILPQLAPYKGPTADGVDAKTMKGKVLCGYQGWFSCKGDGVRDRWFHWTGNQDRIAPDNLTFEMWPDMSDYPKSEWFPASDMKHKDGSQAYLFSSCRPAVVDVHFKWMKDYGIDGVFVQRFIGAGGNPNDLRASGVLAYSRDAANKYGRTFTITYDLSGAPNDKVYDALVNDWKFLVDKMELTKDKCYQYHNGKPVLAMFGFYPERFPPELANKIIDFFKNDPKYGTFLVGSGAWWWRDIKDPGWPEVYRRFDGYIPWNPGNTMMSKDDKYVMATTNYWAADIKEARKHGVFYMPVAYPGFSWDNLQRAYGNKDHVPGGIPRRGGQFLWEQFVAAREINADGIFVAMFDEVDEGTAIFKVSNDPPAEGHFVTYEDKPSDWYLRLVGAGTKMFRKETRLQRTMPEKP